jgi:signal peptidase II
MNFATADRPLVTRQGWLAYGLAGLVVAFDQLSKFWIVHVAELPIHGQIPVLPPVFNLTLVWNVGVSFGFLRAENEVGRWGLVAVSAIVVAVRAVWARRVERPLQALALGLVMGGAIGNNLIDRARLGAVVDFLDFKGLYFPWVFNLADSAITVGVILLLIDNLFPPKAAA